MADAHPDLHQDAHNLLRQHGFGVTKIIRVNPESILYLSATGRPMTAWVRAEGKKLTVRHEPGFCAWPRHGLLSEQEAA